MVLKGYGLFILDRAMQTVLTAIAILHIISLIVYQSASSATDMESNGLQSLFILNIIPFDQINFVKKLYDVSVSDLCR